MAKTVRAWVITLTFLESASELRGQTILLTTVSARRTDKQVASLLRALWGMLRESLRDQIAAARYNRARKLVSVHCTSGVRVTGFEHPFLFEAQLADIHNNGEPDEDGYFEWQGTPYAVFAQDPKTYALKVTSEVVPELKRSRQANFNLHILFKPPAGSD
jgi:hypothetical protein